MMKRKIRVLLIAAALLAMLLAAGERVLTRVNASTQLPEISFEEDVINVSVSATEEELLKGVTAFDPEDGDVTASLAVEGTSNIINGNSVEVTYVAFDSKNHVGRASRTVCYTDYKSPEFELSHAPVFRRSGSLELLNYIKAYDAFDGDISNRTIYTLTGKYTSMSYAGTYHVTLRTTNSKGDTSSLLLNVEITDTDPNPANLQLKDYLVYLSIGDTFDPWDYYKCYETANGTTEDKTGVTAEAMVDTNTEGVYYVTYSVNVGNVKSYTKLAVVVK